MLTRLRLDGGTPLGAGGLVHEAGGLHASDRLIARVRLTSQGSWRLNPSFHADFILHFPQYLYMNRKKLFS